MKKIVLFSTIAFVMFVMSGCANDDERFFGKGEGKVIYQPEIKSDVKIISRAIDEQESQALKDGLILWVSNEKGVVRKYHGMNEIPSEDWLVAGHYTAEAWSGESSPASFDKKWFTGVTEFDVAGQLQETTVAITCKIANVLVKVNYASDLANVFTDYSMTVGHEREGRGELVFDQNETRTGYYMMTSADKNLVWTLSGTMLSGEAFTKSGIIENAQSATQYTLNVIYDPASAEQGGAYFNIVVDTYQKEVYDNKEIILNPIIQGYGFDISQELMAKPGEVGRRSVMIFASSELTSATINYEGLADLIGNKEVGLVNNTNESQLEALANAGISFIWPYNPTESGDESQASKSMMKIVFDEAFTNNLAEGRHDITISAYNTDEIEEKMTPLSSTSHFVINISNDPLQADDAVPSDVWATKATLSATALRDDCQDATLEYCKSGESQWIPVATTETNRVFSATIADLKPGTTYQYRFRTTIDGENFVSDVKSFTTEAAGQLPNAGFESWNTSSTPYLLYANGEQMFWDSGNHGSKIAGINLTTPDNEIKHSGSYSVKMMSQYAAILGMGKFAAGNAFVGQYLKTEGTDGVLGWGRPFTSRPKALKGYVKYTPVAVTDANGGNLQKGDMDEGIIYIALLDGTTGVDKDYPDWPVVVRTKKSNRQLFSKDDANVIAYGEKIFTEATAGDGMIEFEIPIEYFKTDVKAYNIMVTMSASLYGDYFTGGRGSTMWVDDLELVY